MPFILENVIPWGRSMEEYIAMFALSTEDLGCRILSCADGPASFNGQMHEHGHLVVSVDPLYQFSPTEIRGRINAVFATVMEQLRKNSNDYLWTDFDSPEALGKFRLQTMERFLADYPAGRRDSRYLCGSLPDLPFAAKTFDIAICSHFLFLYSKQYSAEFHQQSIAAMLRVANEVRIFPLLTLERSPSPHLEKVCHWLDQHDYEYEIQKVDYEFQRGANQMLRIWTNR